MLFSRAQKAVEGNRVLAHLRVDQQRDVRMKIPKRVKRRKWNVHEVADSAHVHQHLVRPFVAERSAKLSNHLVATRPRLWRRAGRVSTRRRQMSMHNHAVKSVLILLRLDQCPFVFICGFLSRNHSSCRSTESITPITAESMGELGRPTAVMAEKPSVVSKTRSPMPALTASSARTGSPRSEPSSWSGWTTRILRPSCEETFCVATTSPMTRPINMRGSVESKTKSSKNKI